LDFLPWVLQHQISTIQNQVVEIFPYTPFSLSGASTPIPEPPPRGNDRPGYRGTKRHSPSLKSGKGPGTPRYPLGCPKKRGSPLNGNMSLLNSHNPLAPSWAPMMTRRTLSRKGRVHGISRRLDGVSLPPLPKSPNIDPMCL